MNQQFGSISYPVLDQLQLTTLSAFRTEIQNATLYRESAAFGMLKAMSTDEQGWLLEVKPRIRRGNVASHRGASVINTERRELYGGGAIEWSEYHTVVSIDNRTLVQNCNMNISDLANMTSWGQVSGEKRDKLIDLLGNELIAHLEDLTDRLSEDIYGDGTPRRGEPDILGGLGEIISPNKPYAGVGYQQFGRFRRRGKLSGTQNWFWNPIYHDFGGKSAKINHYYAVGHDIHRGKRQGDIWVFMPSIHYDNLSLRMEGSKRRNRMASEFGFDEHIQLIHHNMVLFPDDFCQSPGGDENISYGFRPMDVKMLFHEGDKMTFHKPVIPDNQFTILFRVTVMLCLRCKDRARTFVFQNQAP